VGADGRIFKQPRAKKGDASEPGVHRKRPQLTTDGRGVDRPGTREPGVGDYHPMTMPELLRWFEFLSARLRHVRILNGDWKRALTNGATKTLSVRKKSGACCGIFLDPPYGDVRTNGLYAHDDLNVAAQVQQWCAEHGDDPQLRIVLAGFDVEHEALEARGWRLVEWYRGGFLKGGMGNTASKGSSTQQKRERLWMSPHCLSADQDEKWSDYWSR
jgi:hypothetical protein